MNEKLFDTQLIALLKELRTTHLADYLSLKKTTIEVYTKKFFIRMEADFAKRPHHSGFIYQVPLQIRDGFAQYLGVPCHECAESYWVVEPTQRCGAIYFTDSKGRIAKKRYFFRRERIMDVLDTFDGYLVRILAEDSNGFDNPEGFDDSDDFDYEEDVDVSYDDLPFDIPSDKAPDENTASIIDFPVIFKEG
jgi:hypothetical protein